MTFFENHAPLAERALTPDAITILAAMARTEAIPGGVHKEARLSRRTGLCGDRVKDCVVALYFAGYLTLRTHSNGQDYEMPNFTLTAAGWKASGLTPPMWRDAA